MAVTRMRDLPRLDGLQVLVIDDDADSREVMKLALSHSGATVQTAACAAEALTATASAAYDVLISDIGMPDMDGFEMIAVLRNTTDCKNQHTPAIALTAFAGTEDRKRALLAGFDTFLSKPVDPGEVIAVISRLIHPKR